jgi:hypothetical protein
MPVMAAWAAILLCCSTASGWMGNKDQSVHGNNTSARTQPHEDMTTFWQAIVCQRVANDENEPRLINRSDYRSINYRSMNDWQNGLMAADCRQQFLSCGLNRITHLPDFIGKECNSLNTTPFLIFYVLAEGICQSHLPLLFVRYICTHNQSVALAFRIHRKGWGISDILGSYSDIDGQTFDAKSDLAFYFDIGWQPGPVGNVELFQSGLRRSESRVSGSVGRMRGILSNLRRPLHFDSLRVRGGPQLIGGPFQCKREPRDCDCCERSQNRASDARDIVEALHRRWALQGWLFFGGLPFLIWLFVWDWRRTPYNRRRRDPDRPTGKQSDRKGTDL